MLCLDWDGEEPIEIMGKETDADYARFEVFMTPCNYLHTMLGYKDDTVSPECVKDLES